MPEEMNTLWTSEESRPVDHVGASIEDGFDQFGVFTRVVFEIRVLNQKNIAAGLVKTASQRGAFPLIVLLK